MDVNMDDTSTVGRDADLVSHSPIDPDADPGRRAWMVCPNCDTGVECPQCQSSRNCDTHWQYLLRNNGTRVFLQCSMCFSVWTVDTADRDRHASAVVSRNKGNDAAAIKPDVTCDAPAGQPEGSDDAARDEAVIAKVFIGDCPRDIVTSRDGDPIYVLAADSVKVVSGFHHVVASIPIVPEPKQMIMSADGSRIYVTSYGGWLSIIDPSKRTAKTFATPRNTAAVVSPDGEYVYLAHGDKIGRHTASWITTIRADGAFVARNAVARCTTGMALSRDGHRLYVASGGPGSDQHGGTVTVIDTTNRKTVDTIPVGEAPETLAVDAEGLLYVTHYHTDSISVIDPATHSGLSVALGDAPIEIMSATKREFIYTANLHSVSAINISTAVSKTLAIGELPRRLNIGVDGRCLYVTDFAHGTIWGLDTLDNSVTGTVAVGAHPAAVALSPDGELLHVTDSRDGTLRVISTALLKPNPQDAA